MSDRVLRRTNIVAGLAFVIMLIAAAIVYAGEICPRCLSGDGCRCAPNVRNFGYYRRIWRRPPEEGEAGRQRDGSDRQELQAKPFVKPPADSEEDLAPQPSVDDPFKDAPEGDDEIDSSSGPDRKTGRFAVPVGHSPNEPAEFQLPVHYRLPVHMRNKRQGPMVATLEKTASVGEPIDVYGVNTTKPIRSHNNPFRTEVREPSDRDRNSRPSEKLVPIPSTRTNQAIDDSVVPATAIRAVSESLLESLPEQDQDIAPSPSEQFPKPYSSPGPSYSMPNRIEIDTETLPIQDAHPVGAGSENIKRFYGNPLRSTTDTTNRYPVRKTSGIETVYQSGQKTRWNGVRKGSNPLR